MYNIYFEAAAIGFVALYLLYLYIEYPNESLSNLCYRKMVTWLLLSETFDVVTAVTIDHGADIPPFLNVILNTIFFLVSARLALSYACYVESFVKKKEHGILYRSCSVIFWIYFAIMVGNIFGKYCFWFDENGSYIHGPLYPLTYGSLSIICILGLVYIVCHRKNFEKRQIWALWLFIALFVSGFVLQIFFFPHTLLAMYMASLAATVFLFVIETPDYQKLKKAMKDLEEARKSADAANQAKSIFLAKMSHEIRTPINAVIGMNEMILREEPDLHIQEYAMDIKRSAETLLSTINDILDLSKVESGKMEIIPEEYDVSSLLHDVLNMISFKAKDKNLKVELSLDEKIPSRLYGDDIRIRQILINILNNAVKYTEQGSITFTATASIENESAVLHFSVKDTGIGIRKEDMERLFSEYARLEESRNRNIEGTGLGMNITQQLLTLMGSELHVESTYGKGSCFSFDLEQKIMDSEPIGNLEKRISEQAASYSYNASFIAPKAQILLVDDNATNRKVCISLLKETEVNIDEASGGYECLEMVKEKHYDVILLDHMMPDLDGVETLKKMNTLEINMCKDVPVVALTANAVSGAEEMYKEAGFTCFLPKPIRPEKLEKMLKDLLPENLIEKAGNREQKRPSPPVDEVKLPEVEGFDWEYALLHMKDQQLLIETIKDFLLMEETDRKNLQQYYENIQQGVDMEESLRLYRVCVHSMKNSVAMIGALTVSALAKILEAYARDNNIKQLEKLHDTFMDEWKQKVLYLKAAFSEDEEKQGELEPDPFMISEYLKLLKTAMQECDLDAADEIVAQLSHYKYSEDWKIIFDNLCIAVKNIDEEAAISGITQWEELLSNGNE